MSDFGDSLTMPHLKARVSPVVQDALVTHKEELIGSVKNPVARTALRVCYGEGVNMAPKLVDAGVDAGVAEISKYSVADLLKLLDDAAKSRGFQAGAGDNRLADEIRELRARRSNP